MPRACRSWAVMSFGLLKWRTTVSRPARKRRDGKHESSIFGSLSRRSISGKSHSGRSGALVSKMLSLDGIASLGIGAVLAIAAGLLAFENKQLLSENAT